MYVINEAGKRFVKDNIAQYVFSSSRSIGPGPFKCEGKTPSNMFVTVTQNSFNLFYVTQDN